MEQRGYVLLSLHTCAVCRRYRCSVVVTFHDAAFSSARWSLFPNSITTQPSIFEAFVGVLFS